MKANHDRINVLIKLLPDMDLQAVPQMGQVPLTFIKETITRKAVRTLFGT